MIEVKGKPVKAAYDKKKRKAYMLDKNGEPMMWFTYDKFKLIGFLDSSKQDETKTFKDEKDNQGTSTTES